VAKDRSKKILKEIRKLREEVTARLDALEASLDALEAKSTPVRPPGADFSSPVSRVEADPLQAVPAANGPVSNESFELPTGGEVRVIVQPLHDLSLARVVEDALANTEGVQEASLRELRGDSATIDTKVEEGVSLIASLRRKLPVAFDVTESSSDSVTIALAQPMGGRESGVAAPTGL